MTTKRFVDRGFWVIPKLECIRSYWFPVMNKKITMPRCYPNIYRCIQCLSWHCQSVLILWHFMNNLDLFNFSLRGTKNHPKKPAFSSNIYTDCISCHLEFQKFPRTSPFTPTALWDMACPVSAYFQKFSIYLKTFWEPFLWTGPFCFVYLLRLYCVIM